MVVIGYGKFVKRLLLFSCLFIYLLLSITQLLNERYNASTKSPPVPENQTAISTTAQDIKSVMLQLAGKDKLLYVSSVDSVYYRFAINLYRTSFKRLNINNYLFLCSDNDAHRKLQKQGINSFEYMKSGKDAQNTKSYYGTEAFSRKTHLKTKITLDALLLGLTVIIIDLDIVLFKNPVPFMTCKECDIQIQTDIKEYNSGFYMARPTKPSVRLHKNAWKIGRSPDGNFNSNQKVLNLLMEQMIAANEINIRVLSRRLFPPGKIFFEEKRRMFYNDEPVKKEVLVHNNWISSQEAKIYRFKEFCLWYLDEDGYYTNVNNRYLVYDNPIKFGANKATRIETNALQSALYIANVLNRILVLPSFNCFKCRSQACLVKSRKCSLNTHYSVAAFDSEFHGLYREHAFFNHIIVPTELKNEYKKRKYHLIQSTQSVISEQEVKKVDVKIPKDIHYGPTKDEILKWFGNEKSRVLKFHSLYNLNLHELCKGTALFDKIIKATQVYDNYSQLNE